MNFEHQYNIKKIISLLEGTDEKSVMLGVKLTMSLELEEEILEQYNHNFPVKSPDNSEILFGVNVSNERLIYPKKGIPRVHEVILQTQKCLINSLLDEREIHWLMYNLFHILFDKARDVHFTFYNTYLTVQLNTRAKDMFDFIKDINELNRMSKEEREQVIKSMHLKEYRSLYRWLELSPSCDLPIAYHLHVIQEKNVELQFGFSLMEV